MWGIDRLKFNNNIKISTEILSAIHRPASNEVTYDIIIPKSKYHSYELITVNIIDDISSCSSESLSKLVRNQDSWYIEISSTGPYDSYSPQIHVELIFVRIIN